MEQCVTLCVPQHELYHIFLFTLVSDRNVGLPTEGVVALGSSQGALGAFLLPMRAAGSGWALSQLRRAVKAKAGIASQAAAGRDLANDPVNVCVLVWPK